MLILSVAEDLDELFQDGRLTAITPLRKLGRIMVVTVDTAFVFVVAVRCAEYSGAYRAGEMLDVVLSVQRGDVRATEGLAAFKT